MSDGGATPPAAQSSFPRDDRPAAAPSRGPGKVYLIGAGPGDPGLLTLRGAECLRRAEVIYYDYLVNPRILAHASPTAELHCLGKHGRTAIWPQEEINRQLVASAQAGRAVARLKGGDPAVFGRVAEEVAALVDAGVPFEIVPGVTAALAAGSYAGIPVTHRDVASAVALVTGQEDAEKTSSSLDFAALARFPGTLVFYMGVTTAPQWTQALLDAGKSPDTPAAIVRRCSLPDQQVVATTLGQLLDELVPASKMRPPVIVILGEVVRLAPLLSWFDRRPLFGTRVLVTRPADQAEQLAGPLRELGAQVLEQPAITIGPPADWQPVDEALAQLPMFPWVVFSSSNGVRYFIDRLLASGRDLRSLGACRLAAIGPGTADALQRYHLRADLVPATFRAESLAAALTPDAAGKHFLLVRASRGREVLADELQKAGGAVTQVVAYSSTDVTQPAGDLAQRLAAGEIDYVTVTSSAIARSLSQLFGDALRQTKLISISPITTATLRELGLSVVAEARDYTVSGVLAALLSVA